MYRCTMYSSVYIKYKCSSTQQNVYKWFYNGEDARGFCLKTKRDKRVVGSFGFELSVRSVYRTGIHRYACCLNNIAGSF